ncbi:hypothetical protein ACQP6C_08145 [Snodgrassella alvi]|uniref:hypothetical protein n=1 Tax=Snodgrassella alvi TaxID=1196083 RepID=UPI003CFC553C
MKMLKTVAMLSISLMLFGCNNSNPAQSNNNASETAQSESKSEADKSGSNKSDNNELQVYFDEFKKQLPVRVSSNTQLVDVYVEDGIANYKYVVTGNKKELGLSASKKMTTDYLKKIYCSDNDPGVVQLRKSLPKGVNHHYFLNDEELFNVRITASDCETK